jgi:pimeloyl-ACP methyl ester carboxylesterase
LGSRLGLTPRLRSAGDEGIPEPLVERMLAEAPQATSAVVPGAGHDLHLHQPERWREVVDTFLG